MTSNELTLRFAGTTSTAVVMSALVVALSVTGEPEQRVMEQHHRDASLDHYFSTSNQQTRLELKSYAAPKTSLGRRLMAIRQRIVASGVQLLTWDEVRAEVAANRGGAIE